MSYMNDVENEAREFVNAMDELRRDFGERFVEDRVILASRCSMSQDTIGESNERSLERDSGLPVKTGWRPYVYETWIDVDDIADVETAELVHEILTTLRDYPIYDDSDYSELEWERMGEYVRDDLPNDLCSELGLNVWTLDEWIAEWCVKFGERDDLLDYWTGSVDDCPLDVEAIARDFRGELAVIAEVAYLCEWLEFGEI